MSNTKTSDALPAGARARYGNLPPLPDPKWIYHASDVPGEDDLYLFAESGDVGCEQCERLYTADQMRAYALAASPVTGEQP